MKISIWGSEISGLVAGASFAQAGNDVKLVIKDPSLGLDSSSELSLDTEPGLKDVLDEQTAAERITLCVAGEALLESVHLFAFRPNEKHKAEKLTKKLAEIHSEELLIITQSNFGIGACDELQQFLNKDINQVVSYVPESLPQGRGLQTFRSLQNLIFGCDNEWALGVLKALFRPFHQGVTNPITIMTATEAEFTKFAVTGMLALRLSYINELANLADNMRADIEVIRNAMAADPRIGPDYLQPGCGFGGLSFSQYLSGMAETLSEERNSPLLTRVLEHNERQKEIPFRKLWRHYDGDLTGRTISIWGTSFKPDTSSMDNSPSIPVITALLAQGARIQIHDPQALSTCERIFADGDGLITYCEDAYAALEDSQGLLVLTEWSEYWSPDFEKMKGLMQESLIVDGRNVYDRAIVNSMGYAYYAVGH